MRPRVSAAAFAAVASLAATGQPVCATNWRIDPQASAIEFHSTQFGKPFSGEFKRFSGHIAFNPGPSPTGDVKIEIDVASLKTGSADRDAQAQGDDWFATTKAPLATFTADRFRQIDPAHYEAFGTLAIKGVQVQIVLAFTLSIKTDGTAEMHGTTVVDRLAFSLGTGSFADPAMVARQVTLDISLNATPGSDRR